MSVSVRDQYEDFPFTSQMRAYEAIKQRDVRLWAIGSVLALIGAIVLTARTGGALCLILIFACGISLFGSLIGLVMQTRAMRDGYCARRTGLIRTEERPGRNGNYYYLHIQGVQMSISEQTYQTLEGVEAAIVEHSASNSIYRIRMLDGETLYDETQFTDWPD